MINSDFSVLRPVTAFVKVEKNRRILRNALNFLMSWEAPEHCN